MKTTNWRTTVCGAASGIALVSLDYLDGKEVSKRTIIIALCMGFLGWLAKDQHGKPTP